MITIKEFPDRQFATKEEMFTHLRENKQALIATKKMQTKHADAFVFLPTVNTPKGEAVKEINNHESVNTIQVKAAINTTNLYDSHGDVHIDGIWNKTVKERKDVLMLQEHKMTFDHIITDKVTPSVKKTTFKELGYVLSGTTEALVFDSEISKDRNPYMFEQYVKGYVKNHSVGMRYVKLELAINSDAEWDKEEKAVWDKYYPVIANKEDVDENGYFFAVTEAKLIEGSAVPVGSNWATPTISTEAVNDTSKNEPSKDTQKAIEFLTRIKI